MRFFFDFISPYAYIGWSRIHALAARYGRTVEPVPVLFAGLLNHHGQKGPAEIPAKRRYVFLDCLRTATVQGLALQPPAAHPFNPLLPLRVASLPGPAAEQRAVIGALFAATWAERADVTDPDVVGEVLSRCGVDPEARLAAASAAENKLRLREATEGAIAAGVFGVPTVVADGALFWGVDSFAHLERHLEGTLRVEDALAEAFSVPVGASRRASPAG